eukprot:4671528-Prorocentrum_lima.AAC.1
MSMPQPPQEPGTGGSQSSTSGGATRLESDPDARERTLKRTLDKALEMIKLNRDYEASRQ